ncbi:hypothetical protein [Knoellia koreensis]|jgi:hypothetical protein|nr:hypothetical protein [Knoellia sp. DB2414S]
MTESTERAERVRTLTPEERRELVDLIARGTWRLSGRQTSDNRDD